ncbi:MAG: hypothetical protein P8N43_00105 [Alphaproteobacteria bacterium]|nr:hypothetical protein [Alphaproteobacteria bacterium]
MTEIREAFKKAIKSVSDDTKLEIKGLVRQGWIKGEKSPENATLAEWNKADKPNRKNQPLKK